MLFKEEKNLKTQYHWEIKKEGDNIGKYKGFNKNYKIIDDYVIIYIKKKGIEKEFEVLIDLDDLEKLKELDLSWHVGWMPEIKDYYVMATDRSETINGKRIQKTRYLNVVVTNSPKGTKVDHIYHNTMDNRKRNLRIIDDLRNIKNRKSKNSNNKSGYRNVCWIENDKAWVVQLQVEGVNTKLGKFKDVDEAGVFAEQMRNEIYGEYAGNN